MESNKIDLKYANCHIPAFLEVPAVTDESQRSAVQVVNNGKTLTASNIMNGRLSLCAPILVTDTPESIGMMLPSPRPRQQAVTVRDIANTVGHDYPVHVVDVEIQEEMEGWTLRDLVDYFEDEERLAVARSDKEQPHISQLQPSDRQSLRRKASIQFVNDTRHRVLNQISFEFSRTALREQVQSPRFVRDLDWIDNAWPQYWRDKLYYPSVQFYCLTSGAGSFTDFHVDFGGTSVWYHVLTGEKQFILIPPTKENLNTYEQWLCEKNQGAIFLPSMLPSDSGMIKIALRQSETLIIPSGWIHAVYTPRDSLVFGGNFLHGLDMQLQLEINRLETRTRVKERFRFPLFVPMQFYAGGRYLLRLRKRIVNQQELDGLPYLIVALEEWWTREVVQEPEQRQCADYKEAIPTTLGAAMSAAKMNGFVTVESFLSGFREELRLVSRCDFHWNNDEINADALPSPQEARDDSPEPQRFRINLSASARFTKPAMAPNRKRREDMASFVDESAKDDDWTPSAQSSGSKRKGQVAIKHHKKCRKKQLRVSSSKPKSTARQRLLKKVKW